MVSQLVLPGKIAVTRLGAELLPREHGEDVGWAAERQIQGTAGKPRRFCSGQCLCCWLEGLMEARTVLQVNIIYIYIYAPIIYIYIYIDI